MQKHIAVNNILLQNALSGELNAKLAEWKDLRNEIQRIADEYTQLSTDEAFLESEYYKNQLEDLEREFFEKQAEFHIRGGFLRVIFIHPVYVN